MRINVSANTLTDDGLLAPVDPQPPLDINALFDLVSFRASKTTFSPFEEIEIEWSIKPKDPNTEFGDFLFSLVATSAVLVDDLNASSTFTFSPHKNTLLKIQGHHRGRGGATTLGHGIALSVDESSCLVQEFLRVVLDEAVKTALSNLTSQTAELRLRGTVVSTWNLGSIEYYFPLELVLPNFYNGDVDVNIVIKFDVHHDGRKSDLEVMINHSSDVNFHWAEDIFSFGGSAIIANTADRLVPLILECETGKLELQIIRLFLAFLGRAVDTHRLLDVRVVPLGSPRLDIIAFILCPLPAEPEPIKTDAPDAGGLAPLGGG